MDSVGESKQRNLSLYVTQRNISNPPVAGPSKIDVLFRETVLEPDAVCVNHCSIDFAGFPAPTGLYFVNCSLLGPSGEVMLASKRQPILLAINGGANPSGVMSEYHFADLVNDISKKSDEVLPGIQFWFTDIDGTPVRFDTARTFCLSIMFLYKRKILNK